MIMEEIGQVNAAVTPFDYLLGLMVVVLLAVGIVLVMANRDSSDYFRVPVIPPQHLISYSVTQGG